MTSEPRGAATYGSLRPDIARIAAKYAGADHCGFHGVVSIYGLAEGPHDLQVTVTANDGQVMELEQVFTVDSASVIDGGLPAISTTEPNSPSARPNDSAPPMLKRSAPVCF